jgi:CRP/FNR family transcriptional regulator, cyclic AMP receptor protein
VTDKHAMAEALRTDTGFAACFLYQMLRRNMRLQNQLVDQLLNSSEKRVGRPLILLARFGATEDAPNARPKVSPSTLAAMVGTTRSRVNFFLNKFSQVGIHRER